jgi:methyl-accepting chemotaxis protein
MIGPRFDSIRDRLVVGFGVLVLLLVIAGVTARGALTAMSDAIASTLTGVQEEAQLSSRLSANTARQISAAIHYVDQRDSASRTQFAALGWDSHRIVRTMNRRQGQSPQEVALIADIDRRLADLESRYALAHRLADLGRQGNAVVEAETANPVVTQLLNDVQQLGMLKADKVRSAGVALTGDARRRTAIVLGVTALALVLGLLTVVSTVGWIGRPLRQLVAQARELATGNLEVRTEGNLPSEFRDLAQAMNTTAEQLSRVTLAAVQASDEVSTSAGELSGVAEQVSLSAGHMATAMNDVTGGAEAQVRELRSVEDQLNGMRARAQTVMAGAEAVNTLAHSIESTAADKRQEIDRAIGILGTIRDAVRSAAGDVGQLSGAVDDISRFVVTVGRIAEQTNLLALNAAIEAARAGAAGRGFAVVADEVRRLAEQAQAAAEDVVKLTQGVTKRVMSASRTIEASVGSVAEIESVSRDLDDALSAIGGSAERTRHAASGVTFGAMETFQAVDGAAEGLQLIARMAEQHAASAEEVSASTEEQSAACEEMTASAGHLLENATRLRRLVAQMQLRNTGEFSVRTSEMRVVG